jgi:hypothetical protein
VVSDDRTGELRPAPFGDHAAVRLAEVQVPVTAEQRCVPLLAVRQMERRLDPDAAEAERLPHADVMALARRQLESGQQRA